MGIILIPVCRHGSDIIISFSIYSQDKMYLSRFCALLYNDIIFIMTCDIVLLLRVVSDFMSATMVSSAIVLLSSPTDNTLGCYIFKLGEHCSS